MTRPWLLTASAALTTGPLGGLAPAIALAAIIAVGNRLARRPWLVVSLVAVVAGLVGMARAETSRMAEIDGAGFASEVVEGGLVSHP